MALSSQMCHLAAKAGGMFKLQLGWVASMQEQSSDQEAGISTRRLEYPPGGCKIPPPLQSPLQSPTHLHLVREEHRCAVDELAHLVNLSQQACKSASLGGEGVLLHVGSTIPCMEAGRCRRHACQECKMQQPWQAACYPFTLFAKCSLCRCGQQQGKAPQLHQDPPFV